MLDKLATQIIDFYDDPKSDDLDKMASVFPDYVKNMHRYSGDELSALSDNDFAVVVLGRSGSVVRKWPLVCPGHVYLAAAFWGKSEKSCPQAMRAIAAYYILEAARKWGVEKEIPFRLELERSCPSSIPKNNKLNLVKQNTRLSELDRQTVTTRPSRTYMAYGLPKKKRYPISSEALLKRAMEYFVEHENRISPEDKFEFAGNIIKQAQEFEREVPNSIKKYASINYNHSTAGHIIRRLSFMGPAQSNMDQDAGANVLRKLADAADDRSVDAKLMFRMLCSFDKKAGLTRYYGRIADPAEVFAGGDPRLAKEGAYLAEIDGRPFTDDDLKKALEKRAEMVHAFGEQTVQMLEKQGESAMVFSKLPLPYKRFIASLAA